MVLLIFKSNYADEFDIEEMMLIEKSQSQTHDMVKDIVKYCDKEPHYEFYFGTNEFIPAESIQLGDFQIIDLDPRPEAASFMKHLLNNRRGKFGIGILEHLIDFTRDRKDEDED